MKGRTHAAVNGVLFAIVTVAAVGNVMKADIMWYRGAWTVVAAVYGGLAYGSLKDALDRVNMR